MKISELVQKLEEIESATDGKARRLCGNLIDDLIEWDLEMTRVMKKVNSKVLNVDPAEASVGIPACPPSSNVRTSSIL